MTKILEDKTFADLGVDKTIVENLATEEITHPTDIQNQSIPQAIKGKDIIGRSKTGSGKTLAFSIPMIMELSNQPGRGIKAIVLAPTRELAKQVDEEFRMAAKGTDLKTAIIYGGVDYEPQFKALEVADVVIGTPGRCIDHIERGTMDLTEIEFFVLDEADRMLDMGFIDDIKRVLEKTPPHKQNFFFSATMPKEARELAESFMHEPEYVAAGELYVDNKLLEEYYVDVIGPCKVDMLRHILKEEEAELALVFTNSRVFTDKVAEYLSKNGFKAKALHGGHAQNKRERIMDSFEDGDVDVLVATDVAARGIDIEGVTHVVNYDVPRDVQTYTHRIGRTARAGRAGRAISLISRDEHREFARIEGDSLRNIYKMERDYRPKKVYFFPKRDGDSRGGSRGGPRKGGNGPKKGGRRHGGKGKKN